MRHFEVDFIKKIGLSTPLNMNQKYFSFFESKEIIKITNEYPMINNLVSIIIEHEIVSKKAINTIHGCSSEGNYYTGKKIVIHLKLKQKILYTTKNNSLHLLTNEFYDSVSIVIPTTIKGTDPQELIDYELIKPEIYISEIILKKINDYSILSNIYILANISLLPCHEIVYSTINNNICNLFLCHDNGKNKKLISSFYSNVNIKPKWDPTGNKIAFFVFNEYQNSFTLNIYDMYTRKTQKITKLKKFTKLSNFCWTRDSKSIIFSGIKYKNNELFLINLTTLDVKQLTFGKNNINRNNPLISPNNKHLGFLQSIHRTSNLFLMDLNIMNIKKITSSKSIKSFDWSSNSNNILYVSNNRDERDNLFIVDINSLVKKKYEIPNEIIKIKKAKYSPNNSYFAFIGSNYITDDIYLYDFKRNKCANLTNNFNYVGIVDLEWEIDSLFIYYSIRDYNYYNLYCISLENYKIFNITNTQSSEILLNYRPKII